MAASPPRRPPAPRPVRPKPSPQDRSRARALGVAGVAALFVVLVVVIALIGGSGGGSDDEAATAGPTATATRTPTPTPSPRPTPTRVPLTPDQKLDRQDDVDVVRSRGFDIVALRDWKPDDTLQVLVGRSPSGGEMAFFFVDGQYLGNDASEASGRLRVKRTDDLSVTLRYAIYAPGDDARHPSGEPVDVQFRYEGGRVTPASAIPDVAQRTPTG